LLRRTNATVTVGMVSTALKRSACEVAAWALEKQSGSWDETGAANCYVMDPSAIYCVGMICCVKPIVLSDRSDGVSGGSH
jgi:hypothetical protein